MNERKMYVYEDGEIVGVEVFDVKDEKKCNEVMRKHFSKYIEEDEENVCEIDESCDECLIELKGLGEVCYLWSVDSNYDPFSD